MPFNIFLFFFSLHISFSFLLFLYARCFLNHADDFLSLFFFCSEQNEVKKIAYPFDMVKRGSGTDGHVTLEDINDRMLMPPTRPIRHPVGDFASHSRILTSGFSLSGKVVIAQAKIHTRGTGSITVIRTKS